MAKDDESAWVSTSENLCLPTKSGTLLEAQFLAGNDVTRLLDEGEFGQYAPFFVKDADAGQGFMQHMPQGIDIAEKAINTPCAGLLCPLDAVEYPVFGVQLGHDFLEVRGKLPPDGIIGENGLKAERVAVAVFEIPCRRAVIDRENPGEEFDLIHARSTLSGKAT